MANQDTRNGCDIASNIDASWIEGIRTSIYVESPSRFYGSVATLYLGHMSGAKAIIRSEHQSDGAREEPTDGRQSRGVLK